VKQDIERFVPLSSASLHIMLSLAGEERHGYGIMQDVLRQSDGRYKLGPGTLYDNLQKLMRDKLVEESGRSNASGNESRRRYYRLTKLGRRVLSAEVLRLEAAIGNAKVLLGLAGGSS
jgi:DNA-binding PadR family transcriptional regulator